MRASRATKLIREKITRQSKSDKEEPTSWDRDHEVAVREEALRFLRVFFF